MIVFFPAPLSSSERWRQDWLPKRLCPASIFTIPTWEPLPQFVTCFEVIMNMKLIMNQNLRNENKKQKKRKTGEKIRKRSSFTSKTNGRHVESDDHKILNAYVLDQHLKTYVLRRLVLIWTSKRSFEIMLASAW